MSKRNEKGREIWFARVLWSYMPCHPMGFLVIFALVLFGMGAVSVGQWFLRLASIPGADSWPFLLISPTVVAGWIIAERHS
ncbi:hypothetical protein SAMN03159340_03761 [Sphingomonas sp. NFR15]|nr:hypothetical protein SAMN03159340_03761 [Sphingomonas sp. NFR15]